MGVEILNELDARASRWLAAKLARAEIYARAFVRFAAWLWLLLAAWLVLALPLVSIDDGRALAWLAICALSAAGLVALKRRAS